ncbi:hypothetical protein HDE_02207 [Halotydeus destructor]|nr:hypothetical protein HDE_02207 [Halotydeus destructor]
MDVGGVSETRKPTGFMGQFVAKKLDVAVFYTLLSSFNHGNITLGVPLSGLSLKLYSRLSWKKPEAADVIHSLRQMSSTTLSCFLIIVHVMASLFHCTRLGVSPRRAGAQNGDTALMRSQEGMEKIARISICKLAPEILARLYTAPQEIVSDVIMSFHRSNLNAQAEKYVRELKKLSTTPQRVLYSRTNSTCSTVKRRPEAPDEEGPSNRSPRGSIYLAVIENRNDLSWQLPQLRATPFPAKGSISRRKVDNFTKSAGTTMAARGFLAF